MNAMPPQWRGAPDGLRLDFVQIDTGAWERMRDFYDQVLGLASLFMEPEHMYGQFRAGPIRLALRGTQFEPLTRCSIVFRVPRLRLAMSRLETAGCVFFNVQAVPEERYGIAYFHDPDGNQLAIWSHQFM